MTTKDHCDVCVCVCMCLFSIQMKITIQLLCNLCVRVHVCVLSFFLMGAALCQRLPENSLHSWL